MGSNLRDLYRPPRVPNNFFFFSELGVFSTGPEASTKPRSVPAMRDRLAQPVITAPYACINANASIPSSEQLHKDLKMSVAYSTRQMATQSVG